VDAGIDQDESEVNKHVDFSLWRSFSDQWYHDMTHEVLGLQRVGRRQQNGNVTSLCGTCGELRRDATGAENRVDVVDADSASCH
jgi:hypothetical protein